MALKTCARLWIPSDGAARAANGFDGPDMRQAGGRCSPRTNKPRRSAESDSILRPDSQSAERADAFAKQLLLRWGVVFRDLLARETLAPPWRELLVSLRRMEARGEVRGGRFVAGFLGEQFARPDAVDALRASRRMDVPSTALRVSAADPLNLVGITTPGPRVSALANQIVDILPQEPGGNARCSADSLESASGSACPCRGP